ncbi:hypothetical protein SAMN02745194_04235 [Roseomonas rosea]|uniref:Uncharacterized protein n=1 Tax=Muricoccus roseus TaxID=198092 RepID=A0A1M6PW74_9PROT|nr:hypothetical protein [Roseomonas rosea]SHK12244.1 hypothetical protein SAMN02745194_04235 [Roseomonas rosea]
MADLWVDPVANPSCFARPRPQDFDPDPAKRRRRVPPPPAVRADPHSIPNMLAALTGRGLKARITRLGDPAHARGHIQVDMPVKSRARFVLIGEASDGVTEWRAVWDGNDSKAGLKRRRQSEATDAYRLMLTAMREGRPQSQSTCLPFFPKSRKLEKGKERTLRTDEMRENSLPPRPGARQG